MKKTYTSFHQKTDNTVWAKENNPHGDNPCNPKHQGFCEDSCQGVCWVKAGIDFDEWEMAEKNLKSFKVDAREYEWIELLSFPPITGLRIKGVGTIRKPYVFRFEADLNEKSELVNLKQV